MVIETLTIFIFQTNKINLFHNLSAHCICENKKLRIQKFSMWWGEAKEKFLMSAIYGMEYKNTVYNGIFSFRNVR